MPLLTLLEAKDALGKAVTTADDQKLQGFVNAATPVIEDIVGPIDAVTGLVRTYNGGVAAILLPSPVTAVTQVTENGTVITDYTVNLTSGILYGGDQLAPRVFFPGTQNIVVTYNAGSATVPANLKLAAIELVRSWWQVGRQGTRAGFGQPAEGDVLTPSGYSVPPRVMVLCSANPRLPGFA